MGTLWRQSGMIARDDNDVRARGAKALFFVGSTTTPLTVYSDYNEATPHEHPVRADGHGRWPLVFIPFIDNYDEQITTSGGTQLTYFQNIPNPSPVEQSEQTVDATQLVTTGMIHFEMIDATKVSYVRLNGRTMGNAASGATERANADTLALFTHLYDNLANGQAAVSGGRGGSAATDYAANKTITLPDWRSAGPLGIGDMGNSALGAMSFVPFTNGDANTPGSLCGENEHDLTSAESAQLVADSLGTRALNSSDNASLEATAALAHNNVQRSVLVTWFIKL